MDLIRYYLLYSWITSKIKTLFSLKDRISHVDNVIYKGVCSCRETYLGEMKRYVEVRWAEHEAVQGTSETAKHISKYPKHKFWWRTLMRVKEDWKKRRILETFLIKMQNPPLNNHKDVRNLLLFRNDVT